MLALEYQNDSEGANQILAKINALKIKIKN